jgi:hypothetical protein
MNPYRSIHWKSFRNNIMRLDNYQCIQCGRDEASGVILHVHHKIYIPGTLPWEYDFDQCETLCAGCHAAHHGKIPPKVGWDFIGHDDLGELTGTCDLCGTSIRHVFMVTHPNWIILEVGEICCDHLTCSDIASNHMESVRRYNDRRKRFVTSNRWTRVSEGHEYIVQKSIVVELRPDDRGPRIRMNGRRGRKSYHDPLEARMRAFDVIESGLHSDFVGALRKQRKPLDQILRAA